MGLVQTYLLAINRVNHSQTTSLLYEKVYQLESAALEIVSPLKLITTLNNYGQVSLNCFTPKVTKASRIPLQDNRPFGPINM